MTKKCERCGSYDNRGCQEVTIDGNTEYLCDECTEKAENEYEENA